MLKTRYTSLLSLWHDWQDRFEELSKSGAAWRASYTPAEQKRYSRALGALVKGAKECLRRHPDNQPEALLIDLDMQFEKFKCVLPKMVEWMQESGYLNKVGRRARGNNGR
jgi:hypothetical protein